MALPEVQIEPETAQSPPVTNGRWAGYRALLGARMKELWREPEVIFWVFAFPLLLALGLGIAFRNKPADITSIAIVNNSQAQQVLDLLQRSPGKGDIHADLLDENVAFDRFRLGQYALVVAAHDNGLQYRSIRPDPRACWPGPRSTTHCRMPRAAPVR